MGHLYAIYGRSIVPLVAIAVSAGALSVITYYYSSSTADSISSISSEEIRANTESQVHDLSQILTNGLDSATTNLLLLSNSPSILNDDVDAKVLFNVAQDSTRQLTSFYLWLDGNGTIYWITNETNARQIGHDRSYREYFIAPRNTLRPYFSDVIVGSDSAPLIYVAYPAIDRREQPAEFKGVVIAAIARDALGNLLRQNQPSDTPRSQVLLLDNAGTILHSTRDWLIDKNLFDDMQTTIDSGFLSETLVNFMVTDTDRSTLGSNSFSFATSEGKYTVASEPVIIDGRKIWTVFVVSPHTLVSDVRALFDQQNIFSALMVLVIGVLAIAIAYFVISSNRRLEYLVATRTLELSKAVTSLEQSNRSLVEVNKQLSIANEQLQVHDRLQREFINVASHEMKTPTQAILFHSDIMSKRLNSNDSLTAIVRNAKRLQKLSNNILDVTRIESQALKLNKERFEINELVSALVSDYKVQSKGIVNLVFSSEEQIFVEADKTRIAQVISNILSNALEFTTQGTITVRAQRKDDEVLVRVTDTGKGIDPEVMPNLFSKFVTKSDKGTGLGLFISKSIVEGHGGRIWAENSPSGASFTFTLPNASSRRAQASLQLQLSPSSESRA